MWARYGPTGLYFSGLQLGLYLGSKWVLYGLCILVIFSKNHQIVTIYPTM